MPEAPELVHGTVVGYRQKCALIRGPSGSGKSDLALRCLGTAPTPMFREQIRLVADDYAHLSRVGSKIMVRAPEAIFGKLEVRGIGVIEVDALREARLSIIVDIVKSGDVERLPDPDMSEVVLGVRIRAMRSCAFETSAALKLMIALDSEDGFGEVG